MFPYKYTVQDISEWDETWFKAIIPSFPWLYVVADSAEELHSVVKIAVNEEIEELKKSWKKTPQPDNAMNCTWNFTVRINPALHRRIAELAMSKNISMNKFVWELFEKALSNTNSHYS